MECRVVKNQANFKEFFYCREHKTECGEKGCNPDYTGTITFESVACLSPGALPPGYYANVPFKFQDPKGTKSFVDAATETIDDVMKYCLRGIAKDYDPEKLETSVVGYQPNSGSLYCANAVTLGDVVEEIRKYKEDKGTVPLKIYLCSNYARGLKYDGFTAINGIALEYV